ncbi:MAG: hypothetical protein R3D89_11520 [Sphingomonadaceae bacterium]
MPDKAGIEKDGQLPRRQALALMGGTAVAGLLGGCAAGYGDTGETRAMTSETTDLSGGLPAQRETFYDSKPDPEVRDASNVWFEEENGEVGMRIGIEHVAEEWDSPELWLDIAFPDGRVISGREHGAPGPDGKPFEKRCGPLKYECIEPFKHWRVTFDPHKVRELSTQILIDQKIPADPPMREVAFQLDYYPAIPPLISGTLTAASREAMKGEQGTFISPRYEQQCRAEGWLSIDGKRRPLKGQVNRIKRQGVRKFEGFWGHCWMAGLMPSGKAFMVNTFPPRDDGKPTFNEGYLFDGSGALIPAKAVEIPWMRELHHGGERVRLVLETEDGRRETIDGVSYVNCRSLGGENILPDKWPIVQQAHCMYSWNGEQATGMMERSTFASKMNL